ncbi:MAG: cyclic nucleotide-binding domain-containing protein, partial [Planctomycetota bacterium]
SQIHGLFLTHIHDDHTAGLTEFVQSGNKIDLFSTPEIARAAFQKLAMLYHQTEEQIAKNFRFIPITPDLPIEYYGMTLTGHYAIHSVPCIGFKLALRSQGKPPFQILYPSDTLKLDRVHELRQHQILAPERYENYLAFLKQEVDLMIYDSGAGIIHADAKDLEHYQAKNYLCVHTDKISKEATLNFSLARGGDTYPLTQPVFPLSSSISFEAFDFLTKLFPRVPSIWLKVLLEDALAHSFNPGQIVLRKNVTQSPIYLLLSGYLDLLIDTPKEETRSIALYPGDLFSAQTLQNVQGASNAAIAARSIGLYLTFSQDLFQNFLQNKPFKHLFQEYYEVRSFLENTPLVCDLDLHTRNELASIAKGVLFPENTTILTQGEDSHDCYLIREGSVQVIKEDLQHRKIVLGKNEIFGERALLLGQKRNATVIANSIVRCYQFDPLSFRKLCLRNTELRAQLEKLIRNREEVPI